MTVDMGIHYKDAGDFAKEYDDGQKVMCPFCGNHEQGSIQQACYYLDTECPNFKDYIDGKKQKIEIKPCQYCGLPIKDPCNKDTFKTCDGFINAQPWKEAVNHPDHYGGADNPYEVIKVLDAWGLNFCLGNAAKYIARAGKKGDRIEDLKKARWYLDWEITKLEKSK